MPECGDGMHHYSHFCQNLVNCVCDIVCDGQMDKQMNKCLFIPSSICPFNAVSHSINIPVQISSLGVGDNVRFTHKEKRSAALVFWTRSHHYFHYYYCLCCIQALYDRVYRGNNLFEGMKRISNLLRALLNLTSHIFLVWFSLYHRNWLRSEEQK